MAVVAVLAVVAVVPLLRGWPGEAESDDPSPSSGLVPMTRVPVYYAGRAADGPRLFRETHEVSGDDALHAAIVRALTGPPLDPDYRAVLAGQDDLVSSSVHTSATDQEIVIDLPATALAGRDPLTAPALVLEALRWTATETVGADLRVGFTVEGTSDGPGLAAQRRGSADEMQSPVQVLEPAEDATVERTFTVRGRAAAFEGTVLWELRRGSKVAASGHATVEECCTLRPFEVEVRADPGRYTLVVKDTDVSDGEGVGVTADTKRITVR